MFAVSGNTWFNHWVTLLDSRGADDTVLWPLPETTPVLETEQM